MQGYPNRLGAEEKGIIPRCAEYIFNRIENASLPLSQPACVTDVKQI